MKNSYTNNQIEAVNLLRSITNEEASAEVIEEIITLVGKAEKQNADGILIGGLGAESAEIIKLKMMDEPDWRKKAALAAMIISKNLE